MRFVGLVPGCFRFRFNACLIRFLLISLPLAGAARAENAAFDLIGPKVEVRVQRAGKAAMSTAELLRGFAIPAGTHL